MKHSYDPTGLKIDKPRYTHTDESGEFPHWSFSGLRLDHGGMSSVTAERDRDGETVVFVSYVQGDREWFWSGTYKDTALDRRGWAKGARRVAVNMLKEMRAISGWIGPTW